MKVDLAVDETNPFATRFVAPGQLRWIGAQAVSIAELAGHFERTGRRAEIIGPHGSGKTTLLHHLAPRLGVIVERWTPANFRSGTHAWPHAAPEGSHSQTGSAQESQAECPPFLRGTSPIYWFQLRRKNRIMVYFRKRIKQIPAGGLLIVDGLEQMNLAERWRLRWMTQSRRLDILVTGHRPMGLTTLYRSEPTAETLRLIVEQLSHRTSGATDSLREHIAGIDLADMIDRHHGNLRECLMELYDLVEVLRRGNSG